jgi:iron complex transport system substrate-binding protein
MASPEYTRKAGTARTLTGGLAGYGAWIVGLLMLTPILIACGSDAAPTGERTSPARVGSATTAGARSVAERTGYPLTIDNCGREVTFTRPPERVVILNGASVAEVQSFIVLGIQGSVVANSQSYPVSDDPAMLDAIAAVPTGGLQVDDTFEVPREAVLAQRPDLVVSTWSGGFSEEIGSITRDQLDELGINSYVTPSNCAYGALNPRPADEQALSGQSFRSSFELLHQLGRIFDVQHRAAEVVDSLEVRIRAVTRDGGADPPTVLLVFPGMAATDHTGLPAVFAGPLYDSIIETAGGINAFAGRDVASAARISAEELATTDVDVLVVGRSFDGDDPSAMARVLFDRFPGWEASRTRTFTTVSDGVYLGPLNAIAIERIGAAVQSRA